MNILVLGHMGMLGNMVSKYLAKAGQTVTVLDSRLRWPSENFKTAIVDSAPDAIVNCIGAIHQKTNEFSVNYELPMWLDSLGINIVYPGTDFDLDLTNYGVSKRIAKEFIVHMGKNTKMLKTSIFGPEVESDYCLMEWFLSNPDGSSVNGFTNNFWSGNTTLTWAQSCLSLLSDWDMFGVETILSTECISKYELLCKMRDAFNKNLTIVPMMGTPTDNCLTGKQMPSIDVQLHELKRFIHENY